jgi:uncharacterized protein
MFAIINIHTATLNTLLSFGADVNAQADCGCTPLTLAACNGDVEVAEALLARGADVSKTMAPGKTALTVATQRRYWHFVELLKRTMAESLDVEVASMPSETEGAHDLVTVLA